jgi:hypothetical protein
LRVRQFFTLGIRLIGIWYLIATFEWVFSLLDLMLDPTPRHEPAIYITAIVSNLIIGAYCLSGAPHLVALVYPTGQARATTPANLERPDKASSDDPE